ncbi:MAG: hypothetical protein HON90_09965 [Halobacteriovoraceae bacterium]|nr:hypothetical protein [Halobacteriovoraceae bacterium]
MPIFALEFKHLELKGQLKELNQQTHSNKPENNSRSMRAMKSTATGAQKDSKQAFPDLLLEISELFGDEYETIGADQIQNLIDNHDIGGGIQNFSGFSWYKPMANYSLTANRNVAPDLYTDKWIVQDTLTIFIEAATLISNLKKNKMVEVSDQVIGAFAGVTFKRTYHYNHFADSYLDGLKSDFSKLFLSFNKFNVKGAFQIEDYEVLKKIDNFSYNVGGIVRAPMGNGFNLNAGALIKSAYNNEVVLQGVGPQDRHTPDEFLRVSVEKTHTKSTQFQLSLQHEFFNLLKLTFFSTEFEYEYGVSNKSFLNFVQADKEIINTNSDYRHEFKNILKGNDNIHLWKKNVSTLEKRLTENLNSKFSFLLFGSMKKRATEQLQIIKDGVEKIFFKNYSESIKIVQNFLSSIFSKVMQKVFDYSTSIRNDAEMSKQFVIEYEKEENLAAKVTSEEKFSIRLKQKFNVTNTHKWYQRTYRKSAVSHAKSMTTISSDIIKKINNKELIGPIDINSTLEVEEDGLSYFNYVEEKTIINSILNVCKIRRSSDRRKFLNPRERRRELRTRRRMRHDRKSKCAAKLIVRYFDYINTLQKTQVIDLMKFKRLLDIIFLKQTLSQRYQQFLGMIMSFYTVTFRQKQKVKNPSKSFLKLENLKVLV